MRSAWVVVALMVGIGAAACSNGDPPSGAGAERVGTDVAAVLDEVEGLDPPDREQRLRDMVEDDGASVTLYTSMSPDNAEVLVSAFEDRYDVDVEVFRADSEAVAQRITEESSAGARGADIVEANGLLLESLDPAVLAPFASPHQAALIDAAVHPRWTADQLDVFVVSWNTDAVPPGEEPTKWEDLADARWAGRLVLEVDDVEWYAGLHRHWVASGRSEADADALFEAMVANGRFVKGHSLMAQLLASGEFDVAASTYLNKIRQLKTDGAPVETEPVVEPLIATAGGVGVMSDSAHPAAAVLFADWLISDAQEILVELEAVPTRADLQLTDAEMVLSDFESLVEELPAWTERYERLVGGREVIDDAP